MTRDLDAVSQLSDTVIFRPFIVFEYNDILYFLVPDRKVDNADPPRMPFNVQHRTVDSNFLRKGTTPVLNLCL